MYLEAKDDSDDSQSFLTLKKSKKPTSGALPSSFSCCRKKKYAVIPASSSWGLSLDRVTRWRRSSRLSLPLKKALSVLLDHTGPGRHGAQLSSQSLTSLSSKTAAVTDFPIRHESICYEKTYRGKTSWNFGGGLCSLIERDPQENYWPWELCVWNNTTIFTSIFRFLNPMYSITDGIYPGFTQWVLSCRDCFYLRNTMTNYNPSSRMQMWLASPTWVPLDGEQVVGHASHGLECGVCDVVGGQDDVARVGGATPWDDGHGSWRLARVPLLHRPITNIHVKLHIRQRHLPQTQTWGQSINYDA